MKKLVIILLLLCSTSVYPQVDSTVYTPTEKTGKSTRQARKANPAFKENRKKNIRTHVICSTIFATCLTVWFNVDRISEKVKPNLYE